MERVRGGGGANSLVSTERNLAECQDPQRDLMRKSSPLGTHPSPLGTLPSGTWASAPRRACNTKILTLNQQPPVEIKLSELDQRV